MFTVVWPLAPLACLAISALEQRAAAFRLCVASRRPVGDRCDGLGAGNAWASVFTLLAWVRHPCAHLHPQHLAAADRARSPFACSSVPHLPPHPTTSGLR